MDEVGVTLPTDEHTTESAVVADIDTLSSPEELNPQHVYMEDIGTQLINVESIQRTIRRHVWNLEKKPNETTVFELKSLLPRLNGLQSSLRRTFAAHAQPPIRALHIFQLPDELLMKISENLRGDFKSEDDKYSIDGIKGIKNLRLTCKRLCDASSHLLLHRLDVTLKSSSLKHLDRVSRHPTISKGIRSLQICAGLFQPEPGFHLLNFITEVLEIMREDHQSDYNFLHQYAQEFEPYTRFDISTRPSREQQERLCKVVESMGKREEIIRSYTKFSDTWKSESDEDQHVATVCQAYEEYNRLLNNQNALLKNGTFVTSVAEAMARMPTVAELSITDQLGLNLGPRSDEMSGPMYASVRENLLKSRDWHPELVWLLPQSPVKLLSQLPLTFNRAGNPLTELRICLEPTTDHKLRLSEELVKDLISATEHLKVLEIDCQLTARAVESVDQVGVSKLVSLFLNSADLRSVTLCFGSKEISQAERLSLEPLLALLPWASLERILLVNGSFKYRELSKHLEKLVPGTYIFLERVHLQNGLWADLLDLLRAKADCQSDVRKPMGGEDKKLDNTYRRKFTVMDTPSPAAAYIRGQVTDNPLRSPSDQDNVDT